MDRGAHRVTEPLHDDLVPHVQTSRLGGQILHHPLVIMPVYDGFEKTANALYQRKSAAAREAVFNGAYRRYLLLHERPYRFEALRELLEQEQAWDYEGDADDRSVEKQAGVWGLVSYVWCDSENIWQNLDEWGDVWQSEFPHRERAMDEDERVSLGAMPDVIEVYRGYTHPDGLRGMSWTVDREQAIWFAQRFAMMEGRAPHLATGHVRKGDVFAYFNRRSESEIVALPDAVEIVSHARIARKRR